MLKFQQDGTLLWKKTWGSAGTDRAYGIDVDEDGEIYVVGSSDVEDTLSAPDVLVLRYLSNSLLASVRTWGSDGNSEIAYGVQSFGGGLTGGCYLSGVIDGAVVPDSLCIKLDTGGTAYQWGQEWACGEPVYAGDLLLVGNRLFVALTMDIVPSNEDGIILEYSTGGVLQDEWCLSGGREGFNELAANDYSLYLCGNAFNNGSTWGDISETSTGCANLLVTPSTWGEHEPIAPQSTPAGTQNWWTTGTEDTGGGDWEAMVARFNPPG